ncbi:hypothetical protein AC579_4323 [Pseudocercospora musae]|uniref:Uncharacterized protein n=1 Tax=Pseudocercospora musae TaxID=113226 RepID=A0A139IR58_9PEZI|nr:hypothetical protein AC579_4323 [Pseudocercospora musae]
MRRSASTPFHRNVHSSNSVMVEEKQPVTDAAVVSGPEDSDAEQQSTIVAPWKQSRWRRIVGLFWDSVDGPPRERSYIQKLDTYMFSYMCLAYFIKQLDQTNISNAFVSGMQEDLRLYGNERNWLNTSFNIGILLGKTHCFPDFWQHADLAQERFQHKSFSSNTYALQYGFLLAKFSGRYW